MSKMPEHERQGSLELHDFLLRQTNQERLLSFAQRAIEKDGPIKRRLGEERFSLFKSNVFALLSGESLDPQELVTLRLDPKAVLRKARTLLNRFNFYP